MKDALVSQEAAVKEEIEKYREANKTKKAEEGEYQNVLNQYKERIKEVEKRIDADCRLDSEVPKILNDAARNPLKDNK